MDANRRQSGIQQLLAAEQESQQIVNAARAGNTILLWAQILQIKHSAREQVPCAIVHKILYFDLPINLHVDIHILGRNVFYSEL